MKNEHLFCLTITEFVDSVKESYPELSDHLNIASIENSNRPIGGDEGHAQSSTSSSPSSHVWNVSFLYSDDITFSMMRSINDIY